MVLDEQSEAKTSTYLVVMGWKSLDQESRFQNETSTNLMLGDFQLEIQERYLLDVCETCTHVGMYHVRLTKVEMDS